MEMLWTLRCVPWLAAMDMGSVHHHISVQGATATGLWDRMRYLGKAVFSKLG